jgi:hypothetical protein
MDYYPITIINDFYEDPFKVREFALSQEFKFLHEIEDYGHVFPGSRTKDLSTIDQLFFQKVCEKLTSIFHNYDYDKMRWSITSSFQSVTSEYNSGVIHQDSDTVFAGVLFLSPNPEFHSGTSLFKENKIFNLEKYQEALKENDLKFKKNQKISYDYHQMFDEVLTVQNVFNSLILYEGQHYHAANNFFGNSRETSRLTQVFFVNRVDADKESNFPLLRVKKISTQRS